MTEQSTPDLSQMSPDDIVNYLKGRYLKPRWPHWHNMGEVSLHEAVWLSFGVEPFGDELDAQKAAQGISRRLPHVMQRYSIYLIDDLRESYDQRMKQCIANIGAKKLPSRVTYHTTGHLHRCFVSLDRFRQWGESLPAPYTFPDEFPRPAAAVPKIPAITTEEGALTPEREMQQAESRHIPAFMTFNEYVTVILEQARLALSADLANGSQGAVPNGASTVAKAAQKPADWKTEARTLADQVAIDRWNNGIQQNSAREIAPKVADLLARNPNYHGERGPRDANTVRSQALKGWKFTPPAGPTRSSGSSGSNGSSRPA